MKIYVSQHAPTSTRTAFTLIELLIVLGIIGLIAAMVVPNLIGRQQEANIKVTKTNIAGFENALKQYAASHNGDYLQGGQEVVNILMSGEQTADGQVLQPYLDKVPMDAWGVPLYYEYPNTKVPNALKPAIWSSGYNRQNEEGAGDDINNWTTTSAGL